MTAHSIRTLAASMLMASAVALSPATAQTILKASHSAAPDEPFQVGMEEFSRIVGEKTNGKYKLQIFPSNQLGQEREVAEQILLGTVDIANPSNAVLTNFVPQLIHFDMPFLFRDRDHMAKVVEGPVGQKLADAARGRGFRILGWHEAGVRHIMTRSKAVTGIADMKGLKIRTMQSSAHIAAFQAMGANPTPLAYGELYGALQSGVVDGAEAANTNYAAQRFFEVAPNWSMVAWLLLANPLVMSERKFQALSADEQKIFLEAGLLSSRVERKAYASGEEARLAQAVAGGTKVTRPDVTPFREAVKPVYEKFLQPADRALLQEVIDTK